MKASKSLKTGDIVTREVRSRMMRAVGQAGTGPELAVRRLLHEIRVPFRIGNRDLPGSPDMANRRRSWALFVHGCFWHGHKNCAKTKGGAAGRIPRTNRCFWSAKIEANRERDRRKERELRRAGFKTLVVWECELKRPQRLSDRLRRLLKSHG